MRRLLGLTLAILAATAVEASPVIGPGHEAQLQTLLGAAPEPFSAGALRIGPGDIRWQLTHDGARALIRLRHPDDAAAPSPIAAHEVDPLVIEVTCTGCSETDSGRLRNYGAQLRDRANASPIQLWSASEAPRQRTPLVAKVQLIALCLVAAGLLFALARLFRDLWRDASRTKQTALLVMLLTTAGTLLRAQVARTTELATDELWRVTLPTPLAHLLSPEMRVNPPLFTLLAWPVERLFGTDPLVARAVSIGAFCIASVALLLHLSSRPLAALIAGALFAFHPAAVAMGASHRPYGLGLALLVLTLVATAKARDTGAPRDQLAAALFIVALPWTHYILVGPALGFALVLHRTDAPWARRPLTLLLPLVPALFSGYFVKQAETGYPLAGASHLSELTHAAATMLVGLQPSSVLDHLLQTTAPGRVALPLSLLLIALPLAMRRTRPLTIPMVAAILLPLLLAQRVGSVRDVQFFAALPIALVVLASWSGHHPRAAAGVAVIALIGFAPALHQLLRENDPNGFQAAARAAAAPGAPPLAVLNHSAELAIGRRTGTKIVVGRAQDRCPNLAEIAPSPVLVLAQYCTLRELGFTPASCTPEIAEAGLHRCTR